MKKILVFLMFLLILCGCGGTEEEKILNVTCDNNNI